MTSTLVSTRRAAPLHANSRLGLAAVVLLTLASCDPNPNGPSAPAPAPGTVPAARPATKMPLKQVGAPIGFTTAPGDLSLRP